MFGVGFGELSIIFVIFASTSIWIVPFWFIFKKAGFNGALSLLLFVPFVNMFVLFFLAFIGVACAAGA